MITEVVVGIGDENGESCVLKGCALEACLDVRGADPCVTAGGSSALCRGAVGGADNGTFCVGALSEGPITDLMLSSSDGPPGIGR